MRKILAVALLAAFAPLGIAHAATPKVTPTKTAMKMPMKGKTTGSKTTGKKASIKKSTTKKSTTKKASTTKKVATKKPTPTPTKK